MSCELCSSDNQVEFATEMMIHFNGLTRRASPGVLVFPRVSICLDCGASQFSTPDAELRILREGMRSPAA
jgi:hypothetical protein